MKLTAKQTEALASQIFECMQADELGMVGDSVVKNEVHSQNNWSRDERSMFAKGYCYRLVNENIIEPENIYDITEATVELSLETYPVA